MIISIRDMFYRVCDFIWNIFWKNGFSKGMR